MDYNKLGKDILTQVGGKENVSSVSHCITRVRFILKDEAKANDDVIKNMSGVLDVVKQGGQYQVVVGPSVEKVYNAIIEDGDIATNEGDSTAANTEDDKGFINKALGLISSIFIPVLGMLSGSGMIKAVLALLSAFGWMSTESGTYIILSALSDALFYFFPVVLGWSAAKRFGLKEIYGMTLGAFLVYPTLVSAASGDAINTLFSGTVFEMDYQLTFLGIPVALQSYASTVIPILLGDGIAVIPSDGKVYAPEDAIVRVAYPTGHAVGLAGTAGDELLIHIGVDTVNLNGQYFTSHVEQGMKVKKGDLLVEFDIDGIKKAGYDPTVMVVITKTEQLDTVTPLTQGAVDTTTPLLSIKLK